MLSQPFGLAGINEGTVPLPSEWVLVGGGARTTNTEADKGAFLTASYPDWTANAWKANSKHHVHVDNHTLIVYAIGLKIQGVSVATLRSVISYPDFVRSQFMSHPVSQAYMGPPYKLIGGGARANYGADDGSLLVYSRPNNNFWEVKSKDHIHSSPATIDAWAIGIQEYIPGFGYIDVLTNENSWYPPGPSVSTGLLTQVPDAAGYLNGWVQTCSGAKSIYTDVNKGRMLCGMWPPAWNDATWGGASSKDINIVTSGYLYNYLLRIRKRP